MILVLVCLVTAVLFVWLLLEFAGRAFGELTMSPRSREGLGLASTPATPASDLATGLVGGSTVPAPRAAPPILTPRPMAPPRSAVRPISAAPATSPAMTPLAVAPVPPAVAEVVESGATRRNMTGMSRLRRRNADVESGEPAAPADPVVEESVTVIGRARRQDAPVRSGLAGGAVAAGVEEPSVRVISRTPKHPTVASLLPTSQVASGPSGPKPEAVESRLPVPDPPAWAVTPVPDPPAWAVTPVPDPPAWAVTPAPEPPPWSPSPAPDPPAWPPASQWPPAPARNGTPESGADWPGAAAGSGNGATDAGFSSGARGLAAMVGSRAREAILGFPPAPSPLPPVPSALRDPFAGSAHAPGAAGIRAGGAEPAPGQTVVLVGDDVEAWVRERLYGGRLPDR